MGYSHGKKWTLQLIEEGLLPVVRDLQRMPSANELHSLGLGALANAVCRNGGLRCWSQRLGVALKKSETSFGVYWQRQEAFYLESVGMTVVEQSCKCAYDLLVNDRRVDVKVSNYDPYGYGFVFSGLKKGKTCDFFDLVCIADFLFLCRFVVPASSISVTTLVVGPKHFLKQDSGVLGRVCGVGNGRYAQYRDRIDLLR